MASKKNKEKGKRKYTQRPFPYFDLESTLAIAQPIAVRLCHYSY